MKKSAPYTILETLYKGGGATLVRATRSDDGRPVILKVLAPRRSRPQDRRQLEHEYEIGLLIDSPAIVRPLALDTYEGMPALVMEDFGGRSLDHLLGAPMEVKPFLVLAVRIAAAVAEIHLRNVIHKDLKPENILVHPATLDVKIADLGTASQLPREHAAPQSPGRIEGSLPYMSPEQTGWMNRAIDSRSDLYALGVTFFQMLTGRLPFDAKDPLEWVHCHVAATPRPPSEIVPEIPGVVSGIVLRLLAKMAEDRYQTARGLEHDLDRCLASLEATGEIAPFPLGQRDVSDRLEIAQKLYGRDAEVRELLRAFDRVVQRGTPELVLVSGYPGIGKSSLIRELHRPIVREHGFFIAGKLDQYKRDIPYSIFVQAFADLVEQILTGSEEHLMVWRGRLQRALGAGGRLITDIIPQMELVIGPQPQVPSLPPIEAQNRFHRVFRQLVSVFARREHPLALFLDDLQWLDSGSLELVEDILTNPETRYLLFLGAYRDSEVGPSHPLAITLGNMRETGVAVREVVLLPLAPADLGQLIADALRTSPERVAPLARVVHEKTAGNPFFAIQFLTALQEEGLLELDRGASEWRWDVAKILAKGFTDNVVDLLVRKIRRLPAETQEALKLAACAGSSTDLHTLALISRQSDEQTERDLREAVREGLMLRQGDVYTFLHDRVQQGAYALIRDHEKKQVHLEIGRLLLASLPARELEESIFDVVSQLDQGIDLISDPAEKDELARLNIVAGTKAKAAIAHASARTYLAAAMALLPEDAWDRRHDILFPLVLERAECEYLCGAFEQAEALFDLLLSRARSDVDRATVHELRLKLYHVAGRYDEAVAMAVQALRLFGVDVPDDDEALREATAAEARAVKVNLRGRKIADLAFGPEATDPGARAVIGLLSNVTPAAYIGSRPQVFPFIILKLVNHSLVHGHTPESCMGYSCYGLMLVSLFGDPRAAYEISEMSIALNQRLGDVRRRGTVLHLHGDHINFWIHPIATDFPILERGFLACLDAGDLVFASFIAFEIVWQAVERGDTIDDVLALSEKYAAFARSSRNESVFQTIRVEQQFLACLAGRTRGSTVFDDASFEEGPCLAKITCAAFTCGVVFYHMLKLIAAYLSGDEAMARNHAEEAKRTLSAAMAMPMEATFHYFHALVLAGACPREDGEGRRSILRELDQHEKKLAFWALTCPENFGSKHALVSAEIARLGGDELLAERRYEEAIRSARDSGFVHWEAIANELAARFHQERGFETIANAYLREALHGYLRWGADAKVRQLEQRHPQLREANRPGATSTFAARPEQLDLLSVTKASQTISSEIVQDKLVRTLLEVMLQQGGAEVARLLVSRHGSLSIEAEAATGERGAVSTRLESSPVDSSPLVPASLVHYVQRTKERVILRDAAADAGKFAGDGYLARVRPRSVLCLPILRQGEVVSLLYLENNVLAGAFTPDRLLALELLATQAAISMENARLLAQEREAIQRRDEFLCVAAHELFTPMTSLSLSLQAMLRDAQTGGRLTPQAVRRLVEMAYRQGERLTRLVATLLDVSRIETGRLMVEPEEVELDALVREVVARFERDLEHSRCAMSIRSEAPVVGFWDRSRLDQVVTNLLSNAIKFGAGKPIEIALGGRGGIAWLAVKDHGLGVDPARQAYIFDRFERAVPTKNYGGLGLGLYISRKIVEAHGGTIRVESKLDAGATFTVELPCAGPPEVEGREEG